ncbi:MAG TPA: Gfo/Idh/MocA family oxidoreductase [Ruminiclostridium sp.]|nr:Gfo/Idh/MocA family oxidoreductase [Ruminiclostridium sp.]
MLKIGLAGCGWIAANGHIPAFRKLQDVEVQSVFDIDIGRAKNLAANSGISKYFDSYSEFLQSGIDAVVVTTPNYTHAAYTLEALESGKHVLCEKPFTINAFEAEKIVRTAEKSQKVVMPAFVNRFRQDVRLMKDMVDKYAGDIRQVNAGWIRKSGVPRPGTWFTSRELSGGGVLIDLGSHIVDLCLMITGIKPIKDISLRTSYSMAENFRSSASWFAADYNSNLPVDVEDFADAHVVFADMSDMHIKLGWLAPVKADYTYFSVVGSKGSVELKTLFGFSNQRLWKDDLLTISVNGKTEAIDLNSATNKTLEAFNIMAEQFTSRIINGEKPGFLTCKDGYNTVRLIEKLYDSEIKGSIDLLEFSWE